MEEKKTFFDYLAYAFMIFGVTILILTVLALVCGEEAKEVSTIFALGDGGIPLSTILQFFLTSILTTMVNIAFFSERLIKKIPLWCRTVGMLLAEVAMIILFVVVFDWFPVDMWEPWVMFSLSFGLCFCISVGITVLKEKLENQKMEAALERVKKEGEQNGNSN